MAIRTICAAVVLLSLVAQMADASLPERSAALSESLNDAVGTGPVTLLSLERTPEYEEVLSRSFETILSDSQLSVYAALKQADRVEYRRRFWIWNDPTPATQANEFLNEHVRRLDCALEYFCPDGDLNWDQRGEMMLRFGLPDSRVRTIGDIGLAYGARGLVPPSETWTYIDEEMSLHFIDPNLDGRYILGEDTKHLTARGRPRIVGKGDPDLLTPPKPPPMPRNIEGEHMAYRAKTLVEKGQVATEEVPVSYAYLPPAEPLVLFYEVVTSKGSEGQTDVAVNYEIPLVELLDNAGDGSDVSRLEKRIRVTDEQFDVLVMDERSLSVSVEDIGGEGPHTFADEWRMSTWPGEYVIGLAVSDTASGRTGHGRSRVVVPDYHSPGLKISDIQLATSVGEGSMFRRLGGSVVPRPSHAFRRDERLVIYFEVYGLTEDRPGESRFTVTTEVVGQEAEKDEGWFSRFVSRLFPGGKHSVSSRIVGTGDVPDTAYWFALSLRDLAEDNYELTLTVKDVRSKQETTATAAFTVLDD